MKYFPKTLGKQMLALAIYGAILGMLYYPGMNAHDSRISSVLFTTLGFLGAGLLSAIFMISENKKESRVGWVLAAVLAFDRLLEFITFTLTNAN